MTQELFCDFIKDTAAMLAYNDDPYTSPPVRPCTISSQTYPASLIKVIMHKYSPFLNAAEMAGSTVKTTMKRCMTKPNMQQEIYDSEHRNGETLHATLIRIVKRQFERTVLTVTVEHCAAFMRHVMSYMPHSIRLSDKFVRFL